jgi:hypothetical protein
VSRFIEECRREWKRLRVPDAIANEMAADLAADLAEAEAEGASAEDVLGDAVFDPRAFALSWAEERGVVAAAPVRSGMRPSTALALVAAVLVLVAVVGAALVVVDRPGAFGVRLAASGTRSLVPPRFTFIRPGVARAGGNRLLVPRFRIAAAPGVVIAPNVPDTAQAGIALLFVGLVGGAIVAALAWLLRRRPTIL